MAHLQARAFRPEEAAAPTGPLDTLGAIGGTIGPEALFTPEAPRLHDFDDTGFPLPCRAACGRTGG